MRFMNIDCAWIDSDIAMGSHPFERATWIWLLRFCVGQENGGRIARCSRWTDRKWERVIGVTHQLVHRPSELWRWDGEDLVLTFYPTEQENAFHRAMKGAQAGGKSCSKAKGEAARKNGRKWTAAAAAARRRTHDSEADPKANPKRHPNVKESKVKEGKVRERNTIPGELCVCPPGRAAEGKSNSGGESPFPNSEADARASAATAGVEPDFAAVTWNKAAARGRCDSRGLPVVHWIAFLRCEWAFEQKRRAREARSDAASHGREDLKTLQALLEEVESNLRRLPRFNPDTHPGLYQETEVRKKPLREKRDALKQKISALMEQTAFQKPKS